MPLLPNRLPLAVGRVMAQDKFGVELDDCAAVRWIAAGATPPTRVMN